MRPSKIKNKIGRKLFLLKKDLLHRLSPANQDEQILFILGCQRSGTTLMLEIFENDPQTKTFGEFSKLSSNDKRERLRLNPLADVKAALDSERAAFIVMKPLVESQNALRLLDYFENSHALWVYRDYRDVALSNLEHFSRHNGFNNIKPILDNDQTNWRAEHVSDEVRNTVSTHHQNLKKMDAAVLFWYARNSLYFDLGLDQITNVHMCKYEDLVTHPSKVVKALYERIGQAYPGPAIHKTVHPRSLKRGRDVDLSPEIDQLASNFLDKLDRAYKMSPLA